VLAQNVSAPAIIQYFDGSWKTIERRTPDIFMAGYGGIWTPPPGRADSGDGSVGYDVYDRFDLGRPGRPTQYGTETGMKRMVQELRKAGVPVYSDLIWNHNGFSDLSTPGFVNAGGYPGFLITHPNDIDGDFHSAFATGDLNMRLAGLIDIAQEKNFQYIRNPVGPNAQNLPAGTVPAFGRLANVPDPNNRRFYPDRDSTPIMLFNPTTGQANIAKYSFNPDAPMTGDAVVENATGYLMRQAQWMIQVIGVDGFRLDATKHMPTWVLNDFYDLAVYRSNPRKHLDGSTNHVFSFGENFDGNRAYLQTYIRKDINPSQPGVVGGNRDTKDFPLFFALTGNLTANGLQNDWRNVKNASQDVQDDGFANNGSQGVAFARSHDNYGAYLDTVAHAYILMRPGNAIVYFNAKEFGTRQNDFPKDGRGDALGGLYGESITRLTQIRESHGRGNYLDRTPTNDQKEMLIYEREKSALVVLSNRLDGGYDSRTVQTAFQPGQRLIELTGNASNSTIDPFNDFPEMLTVNADGTVNLRVPRNKAPGTNGTEHRRGYFIYGLATPQGSLSISNGLATTLAPETPTASTNGTARLTPIDVVTADQFTLRLQTVPVNLLGQFRDFDADGDNALLRINGGVDVNNSGTVDFRTPGTVAYAFENFTTKSSPLTSGGDGEFLQVIDSSRLEEGMNYITVRAFRKRTDGGPPVFTDFKKVVYVDRFAPVSEVDSFEPWNPAQPQNRDLVVRSTDKTAEKVHVFLNLAPAIDDATILSWVGTGNQAGVYDRDLFKYGFFGVPSGNNVVTTVTYEITGNYRIQRHTGIQISGANGLGLGDLNFNGAYEPGDVSGTSYGFEAVLYPNGQGQVGTVFNPAADLNGDGKVTNQDLFLLPALYQGAGAPAGVVNTARDAVLRRGDLTTNHATAANAADIDFLYDNLGATAWKFDIAGNGGPADQSDVDSMVRQLFGTEYGDANLDRVIDFDDYALIDFGFLNNLTGWSNGDFDGSDGVDFDDYAIIDFYFLQQGGRGLSVFPEWMLQQRLDWFGRGYMDWLEGAAVPEPGCGLILMGFGALLGRRRR
jgi:glycosidase